MQAAYWWGLTCLILLVAVELGRRLSVPLRVREPGSTREIVKQATGVIATLTSLVLGLLIANGQQSFSRQGISIATMAVSVARLDEVLQAYGSQAQPTRAFLRDAIRPRLYELWNRTGSDNPNIEQRREQAAFIQGITSLPVGEVRQAMLRDGAYKIASALVQERLSLSLMESAGLPTVLLMALIGWSFIVFTGLGLCSDESAISRIACYFAAAASATAVFLVIEFDTPFSGLIQVSREPVVLISATISEP